MPDPEQTTQVAGVSQAGQSQVPAKPPSLPQSAPPPAPAKSEPQPQEEPEREGFTIAGWKERARRHLRVSPHAIAGALHDVEDDEIVTEDELKQRLEEFGALPGSEAIREQLERESKQEEDR